MTSHRGSRIIVSPNPRGIYREGTISGTPRPGTVMQIDVDAGTTGPIAATSGTNEFTYEVYNRDADSNRPAGALFILLPDPAKSTWTANTTEYGSSTTEFIYSAYTTATHCFVYTPVAGEEFNMLVRNASGTAEISTGTVLIVDDGTGVLIPTTGSPEIEPFVLLDTVEVQAVGTTGALAWVMYTGY